MTTNYPPDPGGVFATDTHRRVAGHLPLPGDEPISVADLLLRLEPDAYTMLTSEEALTAVLEELEGTGHATYLKGKEAWRLAKDGLDALNGPVAFEPPPLEGKALEAAEAADAAMAEADEKADETAADERVQRAKDELAEAEAAAEEVS